MKIADLHCDLLSYLAEDERHTAYDPISRASIPLLKEGGVGFQTLAIFTETQPESVKEGVKQAETFFELSKKYPVFGTDIQTRVSIEFLR
jgi:microsomal dipeptidase-like Zn-dependent dipeptidase